MSAIAIGRPLHSTTTGAGPPVVLVHGSWIDHRTWDMVVPGLAESFRVTVYDRAGHTLSPRHPAGSTRRMEEDDLIALIETAGAGPVHLVGSSYGGSIVLGVTARRPDLVLAATVHEPPLLGVAERDRGLAALAAGVRADLRRVARLIRGGDVDGGVRAFVEEIAPGRGTWDRVQLDLRRAMAANHRTVLDLLDDPAWAELEPAALRGIRVPVQLTTGARSPDWSLAVASAVRVHISEASHRVYEDAGHVPHLTHPEEFVACVTAFLQDRGSRGPRR